MYGTMLYVFGMIASIPATLFSVNYIFTSFIFIIFTFRIHIYILICSVSFSFMCLSSGAEIDRFVRMLRDPSSILKSCSAFALSQASTCSPSPIYWICLYLFYFHFETQLITILKHKDFLLAVYHAWRTACNASFRPPTKCRCTKGLTCCCCCINSPYSSQNFCKNCASEPWAPPWSLKLIGRIVSAELCTGRLSSS